MNTTLQKFDQKLTKFVNRIAEDKENFNLCSWKRNFILYTLIQIDFDDVREIITLDAIEEEKYIYTLDTLKNTILQHTYKLM